jgi:hypothetical protein
MGGYIRDSCTRVPGESRVPGTPGPAGDRALSPAARPYTKPYKFTRFEAIDITKPYKIIGFEAIYITKPYKLIGFDAMERAISPAAGLSGALRARRRPRTPMARGAQPQ